MTAQGEISVPEEIRAGPGIVRKARRYTSLDIHRALFGDNPPKPITVEEMDDAIRQHFREKYAHR